MDTFPPTHVPEKENIMPDFKTTMVEGTETGLGFGTGSISRAAHIELVDESKFSALETFIASGELLVPIDMVNGVALDDDGCGDGRAVAPRKIMKLDSHTGEMVYKERSLNRAKVFGGAPAMAVAARIANGEAQETSLLGVFETSIDALALNGIGFGGHTADHKGHGGCGCGAIDNAPAILKAAATERAGIVASIEALGLPTEGIDSVFEQYAAVETATSGHSYMGADSMTKIIDSGTIVKELTGDHHEVAIVINTVEGMTVDQAGARNATDDSLQLFAVDAWRLMSISQRLYPDDETAQTKALQGMLVYTLATAAVLTAGDLPVYVSSAQADASA